ncbi:hypothetical protein C6P40_004811, partial [Pichia californica]
MSKLYIRHNILPVSYKSKSNFEVWRETLIGGLYYASPSYVLTSTESWFCFFICLILIGLTVLGCKNYVLPMLYLIKQ